MAKKIDATKAADFAKKSGGKLKELLSDFKDFALKGNVLDMAVGVIIGGAFSTIVTSVIDDILMPILGVFGGADMAVNVGDIHLNGTNYLHLGNFFSAIVNFLSIALCVFFLVRLVHRVEESTKKLSGKVEEAPKEPRKCPYCFSVIDDKATRCPHCTSELPPVEE